MNATLMNQKQVIIRTHQGVKLIAPEEKMPFRNGIALDEMLDMPFHVYFMNHDSTLRVFNEAGRNTFNILSDSDAIGLTARDVTDKQSAELSIQTDLVAMETNTLIIKDESYTPLCDGHTFSALTYKFPWYNINNQLLGIFGFTIRLDTNSGTSLAESMRLLSNTGLLGSVEKSLPGLIMDDVYFTRSEKVVIAYLIRGKTAREISTNLNRSQRTIEFHIENLKKKTGISTKSELVDKLINYQVME
jgi:DNA-binding CsgD family transcriptional regulator